MIWLILALNLFFVNLIRYEDFQRNTSVVTFRDYWKSGNGLPINILLITITVGIYLIKITASETQKVHPPIEQVHINIVESI